MSRRREKFCELFKIVTFLCLGETLYFCNNFTSLHSASHSLKYNMMSAGVQNEEILFFAPLASITSPILVKKALLNLLPFTFLNPFRNQEFNLLIQYDFLTAAFQL